MLLLYNRPPVCDVCPNNEVTKPRTGNSSDLGSVVYFWVSILYAPPRLLYFTTWYPPEGETHSCPSSHAIAGRPVYPHIWSSAHPGVPCLRTSMPKIPHLHRRLPHRVLRSPGLRLSPSVFSHTPSPLTPWSRNTLLPKPTLTTTSGLLLPIPSHRQIFLYSSPQLSSW